MLSTGAGPGLAPAAASYRSSRSRRSGCTISRYPRLAVPLFVGPLTVDMAQLALQLLGFVGTHTRESGTPPRAAGVPCSATAETAACSPGGLGEASWAIGPVRLARSHAGTSIARATRSSVAGPDLRQELSRLP